MRQWYLLILSRDFLIIHHRVTHLAKTFDIPRMLVRIICTAPKLKPTLLAMLRRSCLLPNIFRMTLTFLSVVASLGQPDPPSSSTLSLPLLNSAAIFYCAISRGLFPKGFHELFMNFLGRHSFLEEVLDNRSFFKFSILQMCHTLLS